MYYIWSGIECGYSSKYFKIISILKCLFFSCLKTYNFINLFLRDKYGDSACPAWVIECVDIFESGSSEVIRNCVPLLLK